MNFCILLKSWSVINKHIRIRHIWECGLKPDSGHVARLLILASQENVWLFLIIYGSSRGCCRMGFWKIYRFGVSIFQIGLIKPETSHSGWWFPPTPLKKWWTLSVGMMKFPISHMLHGAGIWIQPFTPCLWPSCVRTVNIPAPWFAYGYINIWTNIYIYIYIYDYIWKNPLKSIKPL